MARAVYSARSLRALEQRAQSELGIAGYTLMQRAAEACHCHVEAMLAGRALRDVHLLCGSGNNGGDGYQLAALLQAHGRAPRVWTLGGPPRSGDAVQAHAAWRGAGGREQPWRPDALDAVDHRDLIVDALFGLGLSRPLDGEAAAAVRAINAAAGRGAPVLAVDLPSGLDADTGAALGPAVRATRTLTFIGHKTGLHLGAGPELAGELRLHMLGLPADFLASEPAAFLRLRADDLRVGLLPRAREAHKGHHGHVLVVGGEAGMAGAALLATRAALRGGAGWVSLATHGAHAAALVAAQPEAMVSAVADGAQLAPRLALASVVALGPGLGQGDWGRDMYQTVLASGRPLVLDADALNLLAAAPQPLPPGTVLTPHPGEAARLLGRSTAEVQRDRLGAVLALRQRYGAVVVLKGAGSLIAAEQVHYCPYGNPGMAVGGMGDVLTGLIAALMAQGLAPGAAARLGVLAHALAGDAAAAGGERGLLPSDLLAELRRVLNP
ncbi:MAG: NAD(P)H-hydrate dehydratase [Stagnimonas sp.]|nr:NAD(P)H-hydrate dehydratase [Stagnimonas sp.]